MWGVNPRPFTSFPHTMNPGDSFNRTIHVGLPLDRPVSVFLMDSFCIVSEVYTQYVKNVVDLNILSPGQLK